MHPLLSVLTMNLITSMDLKYDRGREAGLAEGLEKGRERGRAKKG